MIRKAPLELLGILFDIYSESPPEHSSPIKTGTQSNAIVIHSSGTSAANNNWFVRNKEKLKPIFYLPLSSRAEELAAAEVLELATKDIGDNTRIRRIDFMRLLKGNSNLVSMWARLMWERVPSDYRLIALDEIELDVFEQYEHRMFIAKLNAAIRHHNLAIEKRTFNQWLVSIGDIISIQRNIKKTLYRRAIKMVEFWWEYTVIQRRKRKRRLLADVMGAYTVKARTFQRWRLMVYTHKKIIFFAGKFDKNAKKMKQGFFRLKEAKRLFLLRHYICKWCDNVAWDINHELADHYFYHTHGRHHFMAWFTFSHEKVLARRHELICADNQAALFRRMEEADVAAAEIIAAEKMLREKRKADEDYKVKMEQQQKLAAEKAKQFREKQMEEQLILSMQRDQRKKQLYNRMKLIKKKFKDEWNVKLKDVEHAARVRAQAFIDSDESKIHMMLKLDQLRKETYAAPSPETMEKEKRITSMKNITFLFIENKLTEENATFAQILPNFDEEQKGYLTHDQFRKMIRAMGVKLTDVQVTEVINGVDADGDGFIEISELEEAMKETKYLGVVGCDWKFYVDPAQDIFCYHNIRKGIKIFEYQITEILLKEITEANYIAECVTEARESALAQQEEEWQQIVLAISTKRMQAMARRWLARRKRRKHLWKVENRKHSEGVKQKQIVIQFLNRRYKGVRSREAFRRQLWCTVEKVWDVSRKRIFWHNHETKLSLWDRPLLLKRYGDVENPCPWQAMEGKSKLTGANEVHYWHVIAGREIDRKPDGYQVCGSCLYHLAVRHCKDCDFDYCFTCFRHTHQSPYSFMQKAQMTKEQRSDEDFLTRLRCHQHKWGPVIPIKCDLCNGGNLILIFFPLLNLF